MRIGRGIAICGGLLALGLTCGGAKGDSIGFEGHAAFLNIQIANGRVVSASTVEEFNSVSFAYDTLSHQVRDMTFSDGLGLLGGGFSFAGVNVGNGFVDFLWRNPQSIIDLFVQNTELPTRVHPFFGGIEGTKPFELTCLTEKCQDDFEPGVFDPALDSVSHADATFLGPSPVPTPEPSSMLLLGSGLVGLEFAYRKRNVGRRPALTLSR
jgi:hypothetical protein